MPLYELYCPSCGIAEDRLFGSYDQMRSLVEDGEPCGHCGKPLLRVAATGGFVVKGFNAANGYSGGGGGGRSAGGAA